MDSGQTSSPHVTFNGFQGLPGQEQRSHDVIRAALQDSIKDQHVPASLRPLLEATYADRSDAQEALNAWGRNKQLQPGGTFKVCLDTLRPRGNKRGHRTFARCNVKECPWKVELKEGPAGRYGALKANLSHSDTGHHPPDASVQEKRAAGDCWLPPHLLTHASTMHRAGCDTSTVLKVINTMARENEEEKTGLAHPQQPFSDSRWAQARRREWSH